MFELNSSNRQSVSSEDVFEEDDDDVKEECDEVEDSCVIGSWELDVLSVDEYSADKWEDELFKKIEEWDYVLWCNKFK